MKSQIVALFLGLFLSFQSFAQEEKPGVTSKFADRLVFGGGIGLQFGTLTFIDISPVIGYRVTSRLESGIGLTYKYYRYKDFYYDVATNQRFDLRSHMFGASIYSRYSILENIFAHVEFERLRYNYEDIYSSGGQIVKDPTFTYINSFFVGGGYKQRISNSSYFYILGLWDLIQDPMSPYQNPVLRMGVLLGR